ncbi:MAG: AMP-binding protein [Sulfuricaulis sp.]|nr:AMP-binding protein [Sulfuricaulis sp.]
MLNAGLRTIAAQSPGQTAVVHGATRMTYAELEADANRFAQVFRERGLARGDHVAYLLTNGPEILSLAWAAYRCGLYLTSLPPTLTQRDAAFIIADCQARVVIAHAAWRALSESLPAQCPAVSHWFSLGAVLEGYEALQPLLERSPDRPIEDESPGALMLYTSGITGPLRGVWRPLADAQYTGQPLFAQDIVESFDLSGSSVRYLSATPLYHAAALRTSLAVTMSGGTVFAMDRFHADAALNLLESERITHSQWVPTMFQRCLALPEARRAAHHAPHHRVAFHGAAPCPPAVKKAMIDWWGPVLFEYYGGTEGVGVTAISAEEWLAKPGSVGRARRGRIHILGRDDGELPVGKIGRIFFSGAVPFTYFNDAVKTKTHTSTQGFQTLGDIGHIDEDGYLYLANRTGIPM